MRKVTEMSTSDLYAEVLLVGDQIDANIKAIERMQETVDELLCREQDLYDEIWDRENEQI